MIFNLFEQTMRTGTRKLKPNLKKEPISDDTEIDFVTKFKSIVSCIKNCKCCCSKCSIEQKSDIHECHALLNRTHISLDTLKGTNDTCQQLVHELQLKMSKTKFSMNRKKSILDLLRFT